PHTAGRISLIHNGIIENYIELRERLAAEGREFKSETDTEIAAHLVDSYLKESDDPYEAFKKACADIRGSFAFLAIDSENPDRILVAKNATPIVIGEGQGEVVIASDIPAVLEITKDIRVLEDGDIAEVRLDSLRIENNGEPVERVLQHISWDPVTAQKGGFKHFMLKEINEQPEVIADTFRGRIVRDPAGVTLPEIGLSAEDISRIDRILLLACGTALHACLVAKFYLEEFTGIPCEVDYASEFRYRTPVFNEKTLVIAISQSGETADTLAAVESASGTARTLGICNVLGSSLARKVNHVMFTHAGPEISVASTKAFTTQIVAAYLLAIYLGLERGTLDSERSLQLLDALTRAPQAVSDAIKSESLVEGVARKYHRSRGFLFIGRGNCYPIALEGALKLKEISYIHAEGYPAGEMKHGPIALIDEELPVVVVLQREKRIYDKALSNLREVESRGGRIIAVTDADDTAELEALSDTVIKVPFVSNELSPLVLTIPLQLLAYYVAVHNGTDVDLPRNLAKSVTVE
ncbi:MAG: glutamine--fructose-6-phosphate transaminase (isomerizing), partial [Candidatus Dadabacteria bacterium]